VLTPQEKKITSLYFGLETGTAMNLEMLGKRMGVSKERIRQVKKRALEKIRVHVTEQNMEFEQVA
jgi:DNA-directed RNA polymerase sigma subunit (sigma70/sigma32)